MTDERAKKYAEDCKQSGNLDFPLSGCMLTPKCKICKNSDFKYGTWENPTCKILGDIPKKLLYCDIYDCSSFVHDAESRFNKFFDADLQPKFK